MCPHLPMHSDLRSEKNGTRDDALNATLRPERVGPRGPSPLGPATAQRADLSGLR